MKSVATMVGMLSLALCLSSTAWAKNAGDQVTLRPDRPERPNPGRVTELVVASPRATLAAKEEIVRPGPLPPVFTNRVDVPVRNARVDPDADTTRPVIAPEIVRYIGVGDVFNFSTGNTHAHIRQGGTLLVRLSEHMECVWYEHVQGWMGVKICLYVKTGDIAGTDNEAWRLVGRDGAWAYRRGPSIGRTSDVIGVPMRPWCAGKYELLARVTTFSVPRDLTPSERDALIRDDGDEDARPEFSNYENLREKAVVAQDDIRIKLVVHGRTGVDPIDPREHDERDLIEVLPTDSLPGVLE